MIMHKLNLRSGLWSCVLAIQSSHRLALDAISLSYRDALGQLLIF